MLMKQHSYNDYNRELLLKSRHLSKLKSKRDELLKHKEDISEEDTKKLVEWESDIKDLESELKPSEFNQFPNNVTFGNYLDYLFVPSLVYGELGFVISYFDELRLTYIFYVINDRTRIPSY